MDDEAFRIREMALNILPFWLLNKIAVTEKSQEEYEAAIIREALWIVIERNEQNQRSFSSS